jgi:6-pyruvoyltetrahydropterin/6-carboxytetrahydropterin synthase
VGAPRRYSVVVTKDYLKFSAAHFIAYPGFRERLHGHNYQLTVRVEAELGADGYVLDFGVVKRCAKALCDELDERVIVPGESDCVTVRVAHGTVEMITEDGDRFLYPEGDCRVLPIVHSSAEELAAHLLERLRVELAHEVPARTIRVLEVGVAEAPGQIAYCRTECDGSSS